MYQEILNFWFHELEAKMWFQKSDALDKKIQERFAPLHDQARKGELYAWRNTAQGSLAEVIVLDQFSRNIYRDTAEAFANDPLALALAQSAVDKKFHEQLSNIEKVFLYLPFMHSESPLIHEVALELYTELGEKTNLDFEIRHKTIIDRFGRYPHRNKILGRESTAEELEFLQQPGSSF